MVNGYDYFYLWNREFNQRPEFELKCQSVVNTAIFSPFSSENVIAGCESGSICIYDLRTSKEPVMISTPSLEGHRTPILGIKQVGGRNSNNLVSVSEEGKMCVWSLHQMTKPIWKLELNAPIDNEKKKDFQFCLEPFCLGAIHGDTSGVYIGTNDKNVYKFKVLSGDNSNNKEVLNTFSGHKSIVNAIHINKINQLSSSLSEMMLTGSFDWTVKLWSLRKNSCLYTFKHHFDPITSLHWNPYHPIMFASSDSSGNVAVINLLKSFEEPVYKCHYPDIVF